MIPIISIILVYQDAHELLRHLLDAMRAEEVKRMKAAILKCFGLPENVNPKNVDEKTKAKLKAYGRQVLSLLLPQQLFSLSIYLFDCQPSKLCFCISLSFSFHVFLFTCA